MGCLWVIKINRLFLTDLLSLLQAQGSGLQRFGQTLSLPAASWPSRPSTFENSHGPPGGGVGRSEKLALRSVSEGTTPNETDTGGPVAITGRTPKQGLPWAQGLRGEAQKGLLHPGLGMAASPHSAYRVCGPVNSGSW